MPYYQLTVMWSDLGFTFRSIHYNLPCASIINDLLETLNQFTQSQHRHRH